ncbi:MAG TPA: hypothetical protein VF386_06270, partial [Usitatibacter sp.]
MNALPALSVLLLALAGCASMTEGVPAPASYGVVARLEIGGTGGWDYLSIDDKRHRLYVSRGDHVQ